MSSQFLFVSVVSHDDKLAGFFLGGAHLVAHESLVLCPGIKPILLALEAQNLNHWTTREVPKIGCIFTEQGLH